MWPAGAEDAGQKARPAVVITVWDERALVAPITDATRRRFPADAELRDFPSGTQTKHARVACDRARCLPRSELENRPGARPLTRVERSRVKLACRIAWGLRSGPAPTRPVPYPRGSSVRFEGDAWLVISYDGGNQFGRAVGVVPWLTERELGWDRLTVLPTRSLEPAPRHELSPSDQVMVDEGLGTLLSGL